MVDHLLDKYLMLRLQKQSKSEREKQISYVNACIWNLEKWYSWTYLQGSNRDADLKKGLVDTIGEGEGGMNETVALKHMLYHMQNR